MNRQPPKIKHGDFIVLVDRWDIRVVRAIRVTPQLVFFTDERWAPARERRVRLDHVVFSGPQQIAEALAEQLKSSEALCHEESNKSVERKSARDEKYISAAIAKATESAP